MIAELENPYILIHEKKLAVRPAADVPAGARAKVLTRQNRNSCHKDGTMLLLYYTLS